MFVFSSCVNTHLNIDIEKLYQKKQQTFVVVVVTAFQQQQQFFFCLQNFSNTSIPSLSLSLTLILVQFRMKRKDFSNRPIKENQIYFHSFK